MHQIDVNNNIIVCLYIAHPAWLTTMATAGGCMSVIYGLIPGMILLGLVSVLVFFWAVKNGQYDDMEGPANRILDDDDVDVSDRDKDRRP